MRVATRVLLIACIAGYLWSPAGRQLTGVTVYADPPPWCFEVCEGINYCGGICKDDDGSYTNCGNYNNPGSCDVCQSDWQYTYNHIGNASEEWDGAYDDWCTYGELWTVNKHDVSECARPDEDYCEYYVLEEQHHIPFWGYCCYWYNCWGAQQCPY